MENSARFAQVTAAAAAFIAGRSFRRVRGLGVCGGFAKPHFAYRFLGARGFGPCSFLRSTVLADAPAALPVQLQHLAHRRGVPVRGCTIAMSSPIPGSSLVQIPMFATKVGGMPTRDG
jgi:hypothetical protein